MSTEPDYRFTLANERTYLAWLRTALAMLAGAVAVAQLVETSEVPLVRDALALALVVLSFVVSGWGVGQYPWLLVDEVTISEAAGAPATMQGLLVAVGLAVVLVLPPLIYLLRLTQSEAWTRP